MNDITAKAEKLAKRLDAYYWGIASEEYDNLVRNARNVGVPSICLKFMADGEEVDPSSGNPFNLAVPVSATFGEIREALSTMPDVGGEWGLCFLAHIASCLWGRYEECGVFEYFEQLEVDAQVFHSQPFNSFADITLLEEGKWKVVLVARNSFNSNHKKMLAKNEESVGLVIEELMSVGQLRSSMFSMPASIFDE